MTGDEVGRAGPFVRGAFLCDTVIEGRDGVNSYIRVVDQLNVQARRIVSGEQPPGAETPTLPDQLPEGSSVHAWLVLLFASGGALGRQSLQLRIRGPDGLERDLADAIDVHFDGRQSSGANLHLELHMSVSHEGPYVVRVILDGNELTQVPFAVRYMRLPPAFSKQ